MLWIVVLGLKFLEPLPRNGFSDSDSYELLKKWAANP